MEPEFLARDYQLLAGTSTSTCNQSYKYCSTSTGRLAAALAFRALLFRVLVTYDGRYLVEMKELWAVGDESQHGGL